ncbi:MAG: hypothetical protein GXY01_04195 [Clostridiales bacterium]|jgi:hypothetical protein|nr:hypothetical protein [Clostridiales bacterium]
MHKEKTITRFICLLITFSLVFGFLPFTGADAAKSPFSDVSEENYFYTEVSKMHEQGVVDGYGNGTFLPQNPVKHSEAIKLVCSMAGVDYAGYSGKTDPWYSDVVTWARDKGIMPSGTDPNSYATREEICKYITGVYKLNTGKTNTDAFSDTDSDVANTLYDYGIIEGIPNGDGTVSFGGAQNVKRCDTCIMLYRLSEKADKPDWTKAFALDRSHYAAPRPSSFKSYYDYADAWRYMLANVIFTDSFQVNMTCTRDELQKIMEDIQNSFYLAMFDYMEYYSFLNQWEVKANYGIDSGGRCVNPKFTLVLSNGFGIPNSDVLRQIDQFNTVCGQIVTRLYEQGKLKTNMSVKDKALVLYKYMAYNTKYDTNYRYYNGYDAAVRGTAVCQGYTAMYNYLCNLAGVPMRGMTGTAGGAGHAWSRIYYGGSWYNVDATWGDPIPDRQNYCDETWFWVTDSFLKSGSKPRTFDSDTLVYR